MAGGRQVIRDTSVGRLPAVALAARRAGADAALLSEEESCIFATRHTNLGGLRERPLFLWVTAGTDEAVLVVHEAQADLIDPISWPREVVTYRGGAAAAFRCVEVLHRGLDRRGGRTIGVELGGAAGELPSVSYGSLRGIQQAIGDDRVVDIAPQLSRLRQIKDADAIVDHRSACAITADAIHDTFAGLRPGMTERDVVRSMSVAMLERGASSSRVSVTSGWGRYGRTSTGGTQRTLAVGDLVWLDAGCRINGSWSDFSRAAVIGRAGANQRTWHAEICDLTKACISMVRPGVRVADIARYGEEHLTGLCRGGAVDITRAAGRIGHGIGLNYAEPPSVATADETVLEAGMVVTIEPGLAANVGRFHVEQDVLVTTTGAEIVSTCPWELAET
jgi:Xaa-Pro dipeptidase